MTSPQGGGFDLGNAHGSVTISAQDAFSTLERLESTVRNFATNINNIGSQISSFGTNLSIAMLPVAGAFTAGINTAATFQDSLAEIQARAGLTDEAMEQISATALQLGADTAFSALEASDALLMLLTAGLDTEQALATLPAVLTGAAAAGADLGTTANQVTNIMSSFQLEAAEAARIVEVMNQAAGASPAEMSQMGEALAMVGGDARNFGLSLEQTGAILTVFARNGKVGAEAGTQLRSILTAMTADTDDSRRAWDMVNSSLFDASGEARDFGVVLAEIDAGLQDLSAEDQAFVIQSLAGSYGRVGLNALLASEGIESVIGEMEQQASAADVAQARLDTFNGRMDALKGSVETLMITAFTPFIEAMTPIVEGITSVVNSITAWIDANQAIVQPILRVLGMLILLGPTLIGVGQALKLVGFLIGSVMSPINLLLIGITLLSAAWTANFANIQYWTQAAFTLISDLITFKVMPVFDALKNRFELFGKIIGEKGLAGGLRYLFTTFTGGENAIGGVLRILGVGEERAYAIGAALNNFLLPALNKIVAAFNFARSVIRAFTGAATVFFNQLSIGVDPILALSWAFHSFARTLGVPIETVTRLRIQFVDAMMSIRESIGSAFGFISSQISRVVGAFGLFRRSLAQGQSFWDALRAAVWSAGLNIDGFIVKIQHFATTVWNIIGTVVSAFVSGFKYFRIAMSLNLGVIESLDWALQEFFSKLGVSGKVIQSVRSGIILFGKTVQNIFSNVVDFASKLFTSIRNGFRVFRAALTAGESWLQAFGRAFMVFAASMGVSAERLIWLKNTISNVFNVLGQVWNFISPVVAIFAEWAGAVLGLNAVVTGLGIALAAIAPILAPIGALIAGMLSPIGLAIGLIVLLANAYFQNFGGIRDFIDGQIAPRLMAFFNWLRDAVTGLKDSFLSAWENGIKPFFENLWMFLQSGDIAGAFGYIIDVIKSIFQNADWNAIGQSIQSGLGTALSTVVDWATWVYDNLLLPMFNNVKTAIQTVNWGEVGTTILGAIGTALTTVISWATWIYDNLLSPLVSNVAAAVATIDWAQVGTTLLGAIGTALSLYADYVNWIYTNILTPIVTFAGEAIASIDWYGVGAGIVNAIGLALTTVFDFIAWIVNSIFNPVTTNAEGAAGQIDWGMVGNAILNGIGMFLSGVFNFVTWLYENILSPMVLGAADAIAQTDWSAVGTNLMNAIKNALPNIAQWVQSNIITPITNALGNFNPMNLLGNNQPAPSIPSGRGFGASADGSVWASGGGGVSAQPTVVRPGAVIQGFAKGTPYVPQDMIALIHQGERIVPKEYNPDAGGAGAGGGASFNFDGANFYFTANSDSEARSHADVFATRLEELLRSS